MENWTLTWSKLKSLDAETVSALDNEIPGAYRLSYKDENDNNYYVFFVGEDQDIKQKLSEHLTTLDNACVALKVRTKPCAFKFAEISNEEVRKATVKIAYKHYQPTCNQNVPDGNDDIIVNLT